MKVSFSLSSSSSKPSNPTLNQNNESTNNNKEFITEFDASKPQTNPNHTSKTPIIIPPIPNEWNPQSQHMMTIQTEPDSNSSAIDRLMLMKLKSDLKRLPDGPGMEEFDEVNVEEFARAYMKGYGWYEGRGIGKNAKEDVKVVEFTNKVRAAGQGLGFVRTDHNNGGDPKVLN